MKTKTVAYLLSNNYDSPKHYQQRYVLENEEDIQTALKEGLITQLHVEGMRKTLVKGDVIVLNDKGGYCDAHGVWQIIPDKETIHRALDAMLERKSFRMRKPEKAAWKKVNGYISSTWWVIISIHSDGKSCDLSGNNHDVLENVSIDSLIDL